jgi:hypothetical protein
MMICFFQTLKQLCIYITNTRNENPNENNSHQQKEIYLLTRSVKLHPIFGAPLTPKPIFQPQINQWYSQSNEILLNLSMKCWNSAFNAQGSRIIIAAAVKARGSKAG